jgi:methyl-accepting chemotaxis protein
MGFIVRGRIGLMLSLLLALTAVVGFTGFWFVRDLSAEIAHLHRENLTASIHLSSAERGLWELRFALPNYLLSDIDTRDGITSKTDELVRGVEENLKAYGALPISPEERALLAQWGEQFSRYLRSRPRYFALVDEGKLEEAKDFRSLETNPPAAQSVRVLSSLIETQQRVGAERARRAESAAVTASRVLIGLVALALLLGVALSGSLARHVAERVAEALRGVQHASTELETTATQQVGTARELSSATAEISVTIRELVATSKQISDSARNVATIADETGQSARSGDALVKRSQEALVTMRQKVDETVSHMLTLGSKSQQIGGILELINELAEQTNILSINARIEAAGASEAGRRFAVVADEIRRLADRVGSSAREIRGLIEEVRAAANTTVMATEDGSKAVDAGTRQFDEVLRTFQQIIERVNDTSVAARQIELSTTQQVSAVEQVNVAMGDVVKTAKETEASSQHTLQTAEKLAGISKQLAALAGAQAQAIALPGMGGRH